MIFRWKSRENGEIYFVRYITMWVGTQSVRSVFPNMMVQLSLQSDNCYALNSWKSGVNIYLLNIEISRMVRNSILNTIMEFNSFSAIKVILWFENKLWKTHSLQIETNAYEPNPSNSGAPQCWPRYRFTRSGLSGESCILTVTEKS